MGARLGKDAGDNQLSWIRDLSLRFSTWMVSSSSHQSLLCIFRRLVYFSMIGHPVWEVADGQSRGESRECYPMHEAAEAFFHVSMQKQKVRPASITQTHEEPSHANKKGNCSALLKTAATKYCRTPLHLEYQFCCFAKMSGENLQWSTKFAGLPRRHIGWCLMWFCQICRWHQINPARQVPSAIFWSRFSSPQIAHGQPILCWWSSGLEIPGAADGAIQLGSVRVGGTLHRMFLLIPWSGCTGSLFLLNSQLHCSVSYPTVGTSRATQPRLWTSLQWPIVQTAWERSAGICCVES